MGSELLTESLPTENKTRTMSDVFWEAYPYYIAMGMSEDEYWNGDAQACVAYRKAQEQRLKMQDLYAWRQGAYIYNALCAVAPYFNSIKPQKPEKYTMPFSDNENRAMDAEPTGEKRETNAGLAYMKNWADTFNKRFKDKQHG